MSFCPNCGTKLDGTGNFCNDCGAPVPVAAAVQPMEVQPTMPAQPTSDLRSQGAMFAVTVPANVAEGGQFQANTPNGPVLCTLPPGVKPGDTIQISVQPQVQPVSALPPVVFPAVAAKDRKDKTPEELEAQDLDGCWWSLGCFALPPFAVIAVGTQRTHPSHPGGGSEPAVRTQCFVNLLLPLLPAVTHWKHVPGTRTWHGYDDMCGNIGRRNCDHQTVDGVGSIKESGMYNGTYWRCGDE